MQFNRNRDTMVGAFVVFVSAFIFIFSYMGKGTSNGGHAGTFPVTAVFDRIDGLFEGDEVRMAGIRVGTVGKQTLDKYFRAVVTLDLYKGLEIPNDSSVAIHTDGLFGSKFVVFEPGIEEASLVAGSDIQFTQGAVVVSELLNLIIAQGNARLEKQKTQKTQKGDN